MDNVLMLLAGQRFSYYYLRRRMQDRTLTLFVYVLTLKMTNYLLMTGDKAKM